MDGLAARRGRRRRIARAVVCLLAFAGWGYACSPEPATDAAARSDDARVEAAFREGRSDLWVELDASVEATLPDDTDGSRHQRWIVRLAGGRTLLVAHNLDLAPRVPVRRGDAIRLRGEYEWNERGGVVHWTHRDPEGRRAGGWIEHAGRRYR